MLSNLSVLEDHWRRLPFSDYHTYCFILCSTCSLLYIYLICMLLDSINTFSDGHNSWCFQRFFPSEFGNDVDRVHGVEPATSMFAHKAKFRRFVEAAGVPYTYVSSNFFAGIFIKTLAQLDSTDTARDKVVILGDGNVKGKLCTRNF